MIIGTGGISSWEDAVQMMMCGADAIGVCTHVMLKGYGFLEKWLIQLKEYMSRMGFRNLIDIRDLLIKEFRPTSEITILPGFAKVDLEKCSSCGLCANVGHCNAIELKEPGACFDTALCTGCSTCVDICPTGAISIVEKS
jgi:ferredoxin